MSVKCFRTLLPVLFFVQTLFAQTPPVLVYSDTTKGIETSPYAAVLEDPDMALDIQKVMALPDSCFRPAKAGRLNLGNSLSRFWVRFKVENKTNEDLYFLNILHSIHYLDMYVISENGVLAEHSPSGTLRPFESRDLPLSYLNFKLGKKPQTVYAAIKTNQSLSFTNHIGAKDPIYQFASHDGRLHFFVFGLLFILAVYNLAIYFNSWDTPFLWYAVYQFGTIFLTLHYSGYGYQFVWRHFPLLNLDSNYHVAASILPACFFSISFLNTQNIIPRYHLYLKTIVAVYVGILLLEPLGFIPLSNVLCELFIIVLYFSLRVAAWLVYFKKHRTAKFYLIGWTIYLFAFIVIILFLAGLIPQYAYFEHYFPTFATIAEASFLAFALADRVREIRQQARDAQQLLLKQSEEYELLVQKHNYLLENNHPQKENPADTAKRLEALITSLRTERDIIRKVSIPTMEGIILLPMSDIVRIEALGSYAVFYLSTGKKITASRPIGDFEDALPEQPFFRTHKSHIVNLNCVERYIRGEGGSVVLQDGTEIGVSRTAKAELLNRLRIS